MTSTFPSAPDNIVESVTNATAERDTHPTLHNQLASAVNAIETYLLAPSSVAAVYAYNAGSTETNYERVALTWQGGNGGIQMQQGGTGIIRPLVLDTPGALYLRSGGIGSGWWLDNSGNLLAEADNVRDLGAAAATRPRSLFAATSVNTPLLTLAHRTAPASPQNGDMWTTTAGLFVRINGVTKTVTTT